MNYLYHEPKYMYIERKAHVARRPNRPSTVVECWVVFERCCMLRLLRNQCDLATLMNGPAQCLAAGAGEE
jgi:hypothetical protein